MSHRDRSGLTLGEVLLILVVVVLALLLLSPYLVGSRESARREYCQLRQQHLSQALLRSEKLHEAFPGYINPIGDGAAKAACSWVVSAFPYPPLDKPDLWKQWNTGERRGQYLAEMVCPADSRKLPGTGESPPPAWLSYVVNCGRPDRPNDRASGVFFDQTIANQTRVSLAYIEAHDGAETTLLLSENLQAGWWTDLQVADLGMVWQATPGDCSPINRCANVGPRAQELRYARPSSQHPHRVNVSYWDGHQSFLNDNLDYRVFQRLMAPDDKAAGIGE